MDMGKKNNYPFVYYLAYAESNWSKIEKQDLLKGWFGDYK